MEYGPLIAAAKERTGMTEYAIAKELGYSSVSAIYQVKRGKYGLSAPKLMKLLQLAGKTLAGAATISAALLLSGVGSNAAYAAPPTGNNHSLCIMLNGFCGC